ncbi:MAG TPA: TylF/MycF/NovP-related O-methyltransferase [Cyclobacteriaceae bacterium]|nr:TylF/MycF/NovP-related O-methyltransferase [Cyclobacteriaceae bacterium]
MKLVLIALTVLQLANTVLVLTFIFLAFRLMESRWSYKISKPYSWDEAVRNGSISKRLKRKERLYRDKVRFYSFWLIIERLKEEKIKGAFAEVGVYKGETAAIIHLMDDSRPLHLFDTFTGFAEKDLSIEKNANESVDFSDTSPQAVKNFIDGNENIHIHPGYFPETAASVTGQVFAFVNIDADLYNPTLAALQYFYPRMSAGGVIMVHDYNHNWEGARKAVDAFTTTIQEVPVPVADWQGSIMIVKNKNGNAPL